MSQRSSAERATEPGPDRGNRLLIPREDWLARHTEPAIDPDRPIIDPHHHLWDWPHWRYLLDELRADLSSGHTIVGTVFVQARSMHRADGPEHLRPLGETEFVNGVAAMSASGLYGPGRVCAGIVGHADLMRGAAVEEVLQAHLALAGHRFRGIRHITATDKEMDPSREPPAGLMREPAFREGFAKLAPLDLSFDAWLFHPQIDELTELARAHPDTRIVLDHCGGPLYVDAYASRKDAVFAAWSASIRELARCENVHVKLGGLGMRISGFGFRDQPEPPDSDTLARAWKPTIDTCIEAFGAQRCMFESNFPVDRASYSYGVFWNACKKLTAGASDAEKDALFRGTAAGFYRLSLPAA